MPTQKTQLKTVVITGGSSGIGLAAAKLLLSSDEYRLALVGREKEKLEDAAQELKTDRVSLFACDLRDSGQIQKTVERIATTFNKEGIYGLVNNAGIYPFGGIADTTE